MNKIVTTYSTSATNNSSSTHISLLFKKRKDQLAFVESLFVFLKSKTNVDIIIENRHKRKNYTLPFSTILTFSTSSKLSYKEFKKFLKSFNIVISENSLKVEIEWLKNVTPGKSFYFWE